MGRYGASKPLIPQLGIRVDPVRSTPQRLVTTNKINVSQVWRGTQIRVIGDFLKRSPTCERCMCLLESKEGQSIHCLWLGTPHHSTPSLMTLGAWVGQRSKGQGWPLSSGAVEQRMRRGNKQIPQSISIDAQNKGHSEWDQIYIYIYIHLSKVKNKKCALVLRPGAKLQGNVSVRRDSDLGLMHIVR